MTCILFLKLSQQQLLHDSIHIRSIINLMEIQINTLCRLDVRGVPVVLLNVGNEEKGKMKTEAVVKVQMTSGPS